MNMVKVKSTRIVAIGYAEPTKTMRVLFPEGAMYDYFNVPAIVHGALMEAESKGSFFQEHVVGKMFKYAKVNPREEGKSVMGKNKTQVAAETRAGKKTDVQPAEQPKPAAPAVATQPALASKQMATIETLKAGWAERKVDLSKLTIKDDGKFKLLVVDQGWPTVQVGASGGVTVLELKSYSKAYDAAMDGLALYEKQKARQKKAATPAPTAPAQPAAKAAEKQSVSA